MIAAYDNGAVPAAPSREYIVAGGTRLAKIASGATVYYHRDQVSTRVTTDSNGNVVSQQGHYPFGESWYQTGSATTDQQFTTYQRDTESGNDYALAREFVNRLGRFSSLDPLPGSTANPQSLNRYAYATNDPIDLLDPEGEYICVTGCGVAGPDHLWDEFSELNFLTVPTSWTYSVNCPNGDCNWSTVTETVTPNYGNVLTMVPSDFGTPSFPPLGPGLAPTNTSPPPPKQCVKALNQAGRSLAGALRALQNWDAISQAASGQWQDTAVLAAIGVYESNFTDESQTNGNGVGIFQIDSGYHSNIPFTGKLAADVGPQASYAAGLLAGSYSSLINQGYSPIAAELGAIRDYNASPGLTPALLDSGSAQYLNVHTTGNDYVSNVVAIALNCF